MDEPYAFVALTPEAPRANNEDVSKPAKREHDVALQELAARLRRFIPYRGERRAASVIGCSTSTLNRVLKGESGASSAMRRLLTTWVEGKEREDATLHNRAIISHKGLDPGSTNVDTMTAPVQPPPHPRGREVSLPTPVHTALAELLAMLPATVVMQWFPAVEAEVRKHLDDVEPQPSDDDESTE